MNYRHAFHAGNFADVVKHVVLVGLIETLKAKPAPFCYVDTHAGAGSYNLRGGDAARTGEAADGVGRLAGIGKGEPALKTYVDLLRGMNDGARLDALRTYPGSPLIAATLMRPDDRAVVCELQEREAAALKTLFAADARIAVHHRDGYAALGALLPPTPRRGLVLIDPPFEAQQQEFRAIQAALQTALTRWPAGIHAIWYPIKLREQLRPFRRWFAGAGIRNVLAAELMRERDDSPLRLNGCGMVIVNPPWQFDAQLRRVLPILHGALSLHGNGGVQVEWLVPE